MVADDSPKSERILSEVRKRESQVERVEMEGKRVDLVIFSLREDYYAFYGKDVKEILPYESITYVPGCPDSMYGIINVRGDIESVINIHRLMGLAETQYTRDTRITIVISDGIRSGILVDSVEDVVAVLQDTIRPPISTIDKSIKNYVIGETIYKDKSVTLFDSAKIFQKIMA